MNIKTINNIGELRAYLDEMESGWTEQDEHFLGEFYHQPIGLLKKDGTYNLSINISYGLECLFLIDKDGV